jgi:hypothetical protein
MKTIRLACLLMLWQSFAFAQTYTSTLLGGIHYSFSLLDSTPISSGVLIDRTLALGNAHYYPGNGDSLCSIKQYKQLYVDMLNAAYTSKFNTPPLDTLYSRASVYTDAGVFPLSISLFNYHYIKPDALDSGWLNMDTVSGQYLNVPNSPVSPYAQSTAFVAGVFNPVTWKGVTQFIVPQNLLFTNTNQVYTKIEIDFADGKGYRNISLNEVITVNYEGYEEGSKRSIYIRVTDQYNKMYMAKTQFILAKTGSDVTPDATIEVQQNFRTAFNICNLNNGFTPGDARIYIQYADYTSAKIRKPIIVVEGFDTDKNNMDNRYGDLGWYTFKTGITYDEDGIQTAFQLQNLPVLMSKLKAEGYDVILVDFKDGGKRIEANAMAIVSIIQWVNKIKEGKQELCVMGASMGGLIVRYALRFMEQQNCNSCTRLYTTFDSPHRGANIPVGIQHFVKFFAQVSADAKDTYDKTLSTEAAMQMLVYHVNTNSANYRPQWQNSINAMGHPQKPYRVGLINGASNGTGLGFNAGTQTINYYANRVVVEVMGNVWSVPNSPNNTSGQIVFTGKAPKNGLWTALLNFANPFRGIIKLNHFTAIESLGYATLPYDNAPGGTTETYKEIADANYPIGNATSLVGDNHCFIPSVSAMDINTNNLNLDIWTSTLANPLITPFDAYYFPDVEDNKFNQKHVEVTIGNKGNIEWIINQLKQNEPTPNQAVLPNTFGSKFNYAQTAKKYIKGNTSINSGGILQCNGNYKLNYGTNEDELATTGSTLYLYTADCDVPEITINNGGQFIAGDATPSPNNNKAIVTFASGSKLRINTGGMLTIHKGCKIIIEVGATLIVEQGAIMRIAETGVLEIKGTLQLGNNSTFTTVAVPNQGLGKVRIVNTNNSQQIVVGTNSKISFNAANSGLPTTTKVLEIAGRFGLYMRQFAKTYLFECRNATIEMDGATQIYTTNSITLFNCIVQRKTGTTINHNGVVIDQIDPARPTVSINNSMFSYGSAGLKIRMTNSAPITLANNVFNFCQTGLYTEGVSSTVTGGAMVSCDIGWQIQNPIGSTFGKNISINNGALGILVNNQNTNVVKIESSNMNNTTIGMHVSQGELIAKCNNMNNCFTGITAMDGGKVTFNVLNGGGYNSIENSIEQGISLYASGSSGGGNLNLVNGNSIIKAANGAAPYWSAFGIMGNYPALSCLQNTIPDPSGNYSEAVDVSGNFIAHQGYGLPNTTNYFYNRCTYDNGRFHSNTNYSQQTVQSLMTANCIQVSTGGGGSTGFGKTAANNSVLVYDSVLAALNGQYPNYKLGLTQLKQLLLLNNMASNLQKKQARDLYRQALWAFAEGVRSGQINLLDSGKDVATITDVKAIFNKLILQDNQSGLTFTYLLDKANLLRNCNERNPAIVLLDSIKLVFNLDSADLALVDYWHCVNEGEQAIIDSLVTYDSLAFYYPCMKQKDVTPLGKRGLPTSIHAAPSLAEKILVFPNPATTQITISNLGQADHTITIYSLDGKKLMSKTTNQNTVYLDIDFLVAGMYIMKISSNEETIEQKIIKAQ